MQERGKAEQEIRDAAYRVHRAQIELGLAESARDSLILEHEKDISRRRMAALTDLTPGRIQQIVGKTRMELGEATHRVIVLTHESDALREALKDEPDLLLFGGHGSGTAPPGGPLPPIDKWSIYARADSEGDARARVDAALAKVDGSTDILSVDPFDSDG